MLTCSFSHLLFAVSFYVVLCPDFDLDFWFSLTEDCYYGVQTSNGVQDSNDKTIAPGRNEV